GIALIVSALLAIGNKQTKAEINMRLQEDMRASLDMVVPKSLYDNNILSDTVLILNDKKEEKLVYVARKDNQVIGVAFEMIEPGYSGPIQIIIGVDRSGEIMGTRVISHTETPGLGDKIEAKKDDWILSFNGLSLQNTAINKWAVKKDGGRFDQFSGATITPRAVVKAITKGLMFFNEKVKPELITAPPAA
ncbi:MAG: electron transport complex subunit RsxG, partial [Gammaproteobacteria bacterium]|nr:electron transport complex subunit RsxG [Gammaproteobacteria bacterium]